jgi:Co/Zn/Cd efflux system component
LVFFTIFTAGYIICILVNYVITTLHGIRTFDIPISIFLIMLIFVRSIAILDARSFLLQELLAETEMLLLELSLKKL